MNLELIIHSLGPATLQLIVSSYMICLIGYAVIRPNNWIQFLATMAKFVDATNTENVPKSRADVLCSETKDVVLIISAIVMIYTRQKSSAARRTNSLPERSQAMDQLCVYGFKGALVTVAFHIFCNQG